MPLSLLKSKLTWYITGSAVACGLFFFWGRSTASVPTKVVTVEKVVTKVVNRDVVKVITKKETKPDGTVIEVTTNTTDKSKTNVDTNSNIGITVGPTFRRWKITGLYIPTRFPSLDLSIDCLALQAEYHIFDPLFVGVIGGTRFGVGLTIGFTF